MSWALPANTSIRLALLTFSELVASVISGTASNMASIPLTVSTQRVLHATPVPSFVRAKRWQRKYQPAQRAFPPRHDPSRSNQRFCLFKKLLKGLHPPLAQSKRIACWHDFVHAQCPLYDATRQRYAPRHPNGHCQRSAQAMARLDR